MTHEYENTLRRLIIFILGADDYSTYGVTQERITTWKNSRDIELKKNKGYLLETRLLFYSELYDLKTIVIKNWNLFLPILQNKKRFEIFFEEIEKLRNSNAHGRTLTLNQTNLIKGITSDLKTLITIYHNKNEMKEDYFIRINRISDNLGNVWEKGLFIKNPILRVGDDYELIIDCIDPKDREINYEIFAFGVDFKIKQDSNRFNFKIKNNLVGENLSITIAVSTPSSEYPNKSCTMINLTILPK